MLATNHENVDRLDAHDVLVLVDANRIILKLSDLLAEERQGFALLLADADYREFDRAASKAARSGDAGARQTISASRCPHSDDRGIEPPGGDLSSPPFQNSQTVHFRKSAGWQPGHV